MCAHCFLSPCALEKASESVSLQQLLHDQQHICRFVPSLHYQSVRMAPLKHCSIIDWAHHSLNFLLAATIPPVDTALDKLPEGDGKRVFNFLFKVLPKCHFPTMCNRYNIPLCQWNIRKNYKDKYFRGSMIIICEICKNFLSLKISSPTIQYASK